MTIDSLQKLIRENLQAVLKDRSDKAQRQNLEKTKIKLALKGLVSEALEERKDEFEKTVKESEEQLDKEAKKINKSYGFKLNDAGNFELCACEPFHIDVRPRWNNSFEIVAYKDNSDRTKKIGATFEEVIEFLKDFLKGDKKSYVASAHQKSVENSKDKTSKKKKEEGPQETGEKVEDAVEKEEDLPDKPMQDVDVKKIEKQSDHSLKGEKAKYKHPKKSNDSLTVKLK